MLTESAVLLSTKIIFNFYNETNIVKS